jgi:serine/threonine protein kinase
MQICPKCKADCNDTARFCGACGEKQRGLLGRGTLLQDRYRIEDLLGCGGYGAVYRATRTGLGTVAIKENHALLSDQQFLQEAQLLFSLHHDHLPRVIDYFIESSGRQYLVMDFIEGQHLESRVADYAKVSKSGVMSAGAALELLHGVFEAVAYLHGQQPAIVHGDIKPANIIITPDRKAVLVDFGTATVLSPMAGLGTVPLPAPAAGSEGYAPIEQDRAGGATQRSDIYALGATLYFVLTGKEPPAAPDLADGSQELKPLHQFNPEVPLHTATAIQRAMAMKQDHRFGAVQEFELALITASTTPVTTQPALLHEPATSPSQIVISRARENMSRWRAYKVFLDDKQVATIANGKTITLPVAAGRHTVQVKIDWCGSPLLEVMVAPHQTKHVITGSTKTPWEIGKEYSSTYSVGDPMQFLYLKEA